MTESPSGILIVFEGIDGAGKSAQARTLVERLEASGRAVTALREPTDGPHGRRLRELAAAGRDAVTPEDECELFRLDRMDDVRDNIAPALARGDVVVLDRYYFSTMAYQGALGLDPERIRRDNEAFAPRPDLALYFDLDPAEATRRIRHGRGEAPNLFERIEYLERVRAVYRSFGFPFWRQIDASRPAEEVARAVWGEVEKVLPGDAAESGGRL